MHRFSLAPPGRVGGRKGFCSRAIPGPGPSQNPALCGSPPAKCRARRPAVLRERFLSLSTVVVRVWGILPPPRTPALDKEAPAGPCPHCRRSRAGSFRRQRPGSRWNRQPRLRRLHSKVSRLRRLASMSGPRPQRPRAGPAATGVLPSIRRCNGPFRPGPRRPSVPTSCRSLPADGSLGSPVRCTVKARHPLRADATDRLRGHAPLASLVPRHWWFRDSGPGARGKVLWFFNGITRSTDQAQRLKTTNANY